MIPSLPTLYKLSTKGKPQFWEISYDGATIITKWGYIDGEVQETRDVITKGKNVGKKNETSPEEQALAEAQSQWEKKLKKGYVKTLTDAHEGKRDAVITGGIDVMLAHKYEDHAHKVQYPCYGNVKLDGTRCAATIVNGKATLWSRTRKPINSMPHIVTALEKAFPGQTLDLDGELYAHHLNANFEELIHLVRSSKAVEGHDQMQYWVYDYPSHGGTYKERYEALQSLLPEDPAFVLVKADELPDEAAVLTYLDACLASKFEGAIIRNASGKYAGKRTADLLKVKKWQEDEFPITGIEEGRGKLQGHVGSFILTAKNGATFQAKLEGKLARLKDYFEDESLWKGKQMSVKYFELTSDGVPRFPVGKVIRDYE